MGTSCSKVCQSFDPALLDNSRINKSQASYGQDGQLLDVHDQKMHVLMKQSLDMYTNRTTLEGLERDKELVPILSVKIPGIGIKNKRSSNGSGESGCGQYHLLFSHQQKGNSLSGNGNNTNRRSNKSSSTHDKENAGNRPNIRHQDGRQSIDGESILGSDGHETLNPQNLTHFNRYTTRLIPCRQTVRALEEGLSGTHVYAVRWPADTSLGYGQEGSEEDDCLENKQLMGQQEQCPRYRKNHSNDRLKKSSKNPNLLGQNIATTTINFSSNTRQRIVSNKKKSAPGLDTGAIVAMNTRGSGILKNNSVKMDSTPSTMMPNCRMSTATKASAPKVLSLAADIDDPASTTASVDHLFQPSSMCASPTQKVQDWVTISAEHHIYVVDVGLTPAECDRIVTVTEQVCRGQYAAYTYAKQTLGCREFPELANVVHSAVHCVTHSILEFSALHTVPGGKHSALALDDREPHMVKYDVTKKERQKLDMHTDKSEWTFLLSLSNGSGFDYSGGGTYFECLDSTIHIQRGHALIFPGKLRHCGQRITWGLRFLLVGFLVDKSQSPPPTTTTQALSQSSPTQSAPATNKTTSTTKKTKTAASSTPNASSSTNTDIVDTNNVIAKTTSTDRTNKQQQIENEDSTESTEPTHVLHDF